MKRACRSEQSGSSSRRHRGRRAGLTAIETGVGRFGATGALMKQTARPRPLADVRIVAVEQYGAGPFGTVHLAELGADVIKIEDAGSGGDVGRAVPPYQSGDGALFFETL